MVTLIEEVGQPGVEDPEHGAERKESGGERGVAAGAEEAGKIGHGHGLGGGRRRRGRQGAGEQQLSLIHISQPTRPD